MATDPSCCSILETLKTLPNNANDEASQVYVFLYGVRTPIPATRSMKLEGGNIASVVVAEWLSIGCVSLGT